MDIRYLKRKRKEVAKKFSLHRCGSDDGGYVYTILYNGEKFNPSREGWWFSSVEFGEFERVSEERAIEALVETISFQAKRECHWDWCHRKKERLEKDLQKKVDKRLKSLL